MFPYIRKTHRCGLSWEGVLKKSKKRKRILKNHGGGTRLGRVGYGDEN